MKRILCITPRFPPTNAADHHRVRMALPYLKEFGWEAEVLAVDPEFVPNEKDPLLEATIPYDIPRTLVRPCNEKWTRVVGLGSLGLRSYMPMCMMGGQLLAQSNFDLVFFSTTEFILFALGPFWKRKFNVPYVVDFQDPWLTDYYDQVGAPLPPGGRFKYYLNQLIARWQEPKVMRQAEKTVCVSPAYPPMLLDRYPFLSEGDFSTIPFGASKYDLDVAQTVKFSTELASLLGPGRNWCYVGVVTDSMQFSLRAFFGALVQALSVWPERFADLRLCFVGTDYAPSGRARRRVEPIAAEFGLDHLVTEATTRIPYFSALRLLLEADALIVPGSDDPGYTASKIYPCILARKPLLTIFHESSSVVEVMKKTKAGVSVTFSGTTSGDLAACSQQILDQWFEAGCSRVPETDWDAFVPYTAKEMTRRLCTVFDSAIERTH